MSHIHLDRTSSAELPVVQRAGADPHCFLLMSEAKGTLGAPGPLRAMSARAPPQPAPRKPAAFGSKGTCACHGFTSAGPSDSSNPAQICVGAGLESLPGPAGGWMVRSALPALPALLCSALPCLPCSVLPCSACPAAQPRHSRPECPNLSAPISTKPRHTALLIHAANTWHFLAQPAHKHFLLSELFLVCYTASTWSEKMEHPHSQSF